MARRRSRRQNPPFARRIPGVKFFSLNNAKARKGVKLNVIVAMLYMQPADRVPGLPSVCAFAGACKEPCLNFAGHGGKKSVQEGRTNINRWYFTDRASLVATIIRSIELLEVAAKRWAGQPTKAIAKARTDFGMKPTIRGKYKLAIRLNGTSDLPWEKFGIMQRFPSHQFYDYTKSAPRMLAYLSGRMPSNYHLTFSMGGTHDHEIPKILKRGGNVTIVFDTPKNEPLPKTYGGSFNVTDHKGKSRTIVIPETKVITGDEDDLRFLDTKGVLVGLHFKPPTNVEQQRLLAERGMEGFLFAADRTNPAVAYAPRSRSVSQSASLGPKVSIPRLGCSGYNVVVVGPRTNPRRRKSRSAY